MNNNFKIGDFVIYNADESWYHEDIPAQIMSIDNNKVVIRVSDLMSNGTIEYTNITTDIQHIHKAMTAPLKVKGQRKSAS